MENPVDLRDRLEAEGQENEAAINIKHLELQLAEAEVAKAEARERKAATNCAKIAKQLEEQELVQRRALNAVEIAQLPPLPGKWKNFKGAISRWGFRWPSVMEVLAFVVALAGLIFTIQTYFNTNARTLNNLLAMRHCHAIGNGVHETAEDCHRAILQKASGII